MNKTFFLIFFVSSLFVLVFLGACGSKDASNQPGAGAPAPAVVKLYTCSRHPEMLTDNPDEKCQRCGAYLIGKE